MLFTGWNHTPFPLRHFVNDSNRGLPVAVVVHTWQRRMYRDLPKTFGHNIFLTLYFFSCGEMTIKTSKRVLYPSLRVSLPEGKEQIVGNLPPGSTRPSRMEALDLQI